MNWIERLYEIKNKDLYSQNGEGLILEYIARHLPIAKTMVDIGAGDGFILSNSRHLKNLGWYCLNLDRIIGDNITAENVMENVPRTAEIVSIDIDGNDYWILEKIFSESSHYDVRPSVVVAEFNPAFLDSQTIAYNPDHVWAGDNYYGFSFEAGKKLAEKHGYKVIFQVTDMNMFMVRADLIEGLTFPQVTFKQNNFFKESNRTDWVMI